MIATLAALVFYAPLCWLAGVVMYGAWEGRLAGDRLGGRRFWQATWVGYYFLASLLLAVSLAAPLGGAYRILFVAGVIALGVFAWRANRAGLGGRWLVAACGALVLAAGTAWYNTRVPQLPDTEEYHLQVIQWLNRHGAVHGLALLNLRFGAAVSTWFAQAAVFEPFLFEDRMGTFANTLGTWLWFGHAAWCGARAWLRRATAGDIAFLAMAALLLPVAAPFINSASNDLGVFMAASLVAWGLLDGEDGEQGRHSSILFLAVVGAGAIATKHSALPLALACGAACIVRSGGSLRSPALRTPALAAAIGLLLLVPVFAYSLRTTGYLWSPAPVARIDRPWSLQPAHMELLQGAIRDKAHWGAYRREFPPGWETTAGSWIRRRATDPQWVVPFVAGAFSLVLLAWRRRAEPLDAGAWLVMGASVAGAGLWLCTAPDKRFGAPWIALPIALLYARHGPRVLLWGCLVPLLTIRFQWSSLRFVAEWTWPAMAALAACAGAWGMFRGGRRHHGGRRAGPAWLPATGFAAAVGVILALTAATLTKSPPPPWLPHAMPPVESVPVERVRYTDFSVTVIDGPMRNAPLPAAELFRNDAAGDLERRAVFLRDPESGIGAGFVRGDAR